MIGWITVTMASMVLMASRVTSALEFDPGGNIEKAVKLPNKSPVEITMITIRWFLSFLSLIAVVMVLYGGFTWMTAAGSEERIKRAKDILRAAIIGLIVVMLSWAAIVFVNDRVSQFTS